MTINSIPVLGEDSIIVGYDIIDHVSHELLRIFPKTSKFIIISDKTIEKLYLPTVIEKLENAIKQEQREITVLSYCCLPSESSKSRECKADIEDFMLFNKCTRDSVILALGGGVIGDLAGFVAGTYMRGLSLIQIPTTLLAMVDSSIGGKNGIDVPSGKNLIGTIWQPKRIIVDIQFLNTLPYREFSNGMAEIIKAGCILDREFFEFLEANAKKLTAHFRLSPNERPRIEGELLELLMSILSRAAKIKAGVVTEDVRETGLRNLLNLGHTFGHAYEAELFPEILHGECVSFGMVKEGELSHYLGHFSQKELDRMTQCLTSYNLPTRISQLGKADLISTETLLKYISVDKKNEGSKVRIVLLESIGKTVELKATEVAKTDISYILSKDVELHPLSLPNDTHVHLKPPGSKSITNRALILAALGQNQCTISNVLHSDDTKYMMQALSLLGVRIEQDSADDSQVIIHGTNGKLTVPNTALYVGNAGTASRFLTALCATIHGSEAESIEIRGNDRMHERPIGDLVDALRASGIEIAYLNKQNCLPIKIRCSSQGLSADKIELSASISSQFASALFMAAPLFEKDTTVCFAGDKVISRPYISLTQQMMKSFGVRIMALDESEMAYKITEGQRYVNPPHYEVESDASSATYPLAIAAITGISVTVNSIGLKSMQGDALFAKKVLEPMGCRVSYQDYSITVKGPPAGNLKPLGAIDMEDLTDAFLTAAVLAAVAKPVPGGPQTTAIHGIANQRVKECNRILAMIKELSKFGVFCTELEDGLEVHGIPLTQLTSNERTIETYDDHRVAMAFSVLACVNGSSTKIENRNCTSKTWPDWWSILRSNFGMSLNGFELNGKPNNCKSVLLIGPRGVGKTFFGKQIASMLNLEHLDADLLIQNAIGMTLNEYISKHGWTSFREVEKELILGLIDKIKANREGPYAISLGGGCIETPKLREAIKNSDCLTINVAYDLTKLVEYLDSGLDQKPNYINSVEKTIEKRLNYYDECSMFEVIHDGKFDSNLHRPDKIFLNILAIALKQLKTPKPIGKYVFQANLKELNSRINDLPMLASGASAVQLIIEDVSSKVLDLQKLSYKIGEMVYQIKKLTGKPVIFFIKEETNSENVSYLASRALKWGVDYFQVNEAWPESLKTKLKVKIIESNYTVIFLPDQHSYTVINPEGPTIASINSIDQSIKPKKFFILGKNIHYSQSPKLHNHMFNTYGLPHRYDVLDLESITDQADVVKGILHSSDFGGFSVTIPYKEAMGDFVDSQSYSCQKLGAVNTLYLSSSNEKLSICAENTDWLAIYETFKLSVPMLNFPAYNDFSHMYALVLGAGGTSKSAIYALLQIGFKNVYIINRSESRMKTLKSNFPEANLIYVKSESDVKVKPIVAISTISASLDLDINLKKLIEHSLDHQGLCYIEMSYNPPCGPTMTYVKNRGWQSVIPGIHLLVRQGIEQFKIWTNIEPNFDEVIKIFTN